MNREDLYEKLRKKGLPLNTSKIIVDTFISEIVSNLIEGKKVLIKNFASFSTRKKEGITITSNTLQKKIYVPEHKVIKTSFSRNLKKSLLNLKVKN